MLSSQYHVLFLVENILIFSSAFRREMAANCRTSHLVRISCYPVFVVREKRKLDLATQMSFNFIQIMYVCLCACIF